MKITEIDIEQFGVWRDLALPLTNSGLNVFYGPNEAGKSTLMRFIRGVLYGYEPLKIEHHGPRPRPFAWNGALRVEQGGKPCEIRRAWNPRNDGDAASRGTLTVSALDRSESADSILGEFLGGTEEHVFERVFAIGLHELQELATLHHEDVARHIYGISLGPEGQRLLDVIAAAEEERVRLVGADGQSGEIGELLEREAELTQTIEMLDELRDRHEELCRDRDALEDEIAALKERRSSAQQNLRGHVFLERIAGPWRQVREYRAELEQIPQIGLFPENGVARLEALESELDSAVRCRDALIAEANELRRQIEALDDSMQLASHAAAMQAFVDQRDWIGEVIDESTSAERHAVERKAELEEKLTAIGPDWSLKRLEQVDRGPAAQHRLVQAARDFQAATAKHRKARRFLTRMSKRTHEQGQSIDARVRELGGRTPAEALEETRERLVDLQNLGELKLHETELEHRRKAITTQLKSIASRPALPTWVYVFLAFFGVAGLAAAAIGLRNGLHGNVLVGAMWATLGITCGLLTWGLKIHFESSDRDSFDRLETEGYEIDVQLRKVREEIARHTGTDPRIVSPDTEEISKADLIRETAQSLAELEQLAVGEQKIRETRRKLSEMRARFQRVQREFSTARQTWCDLLRQLGLPETVDVDATFATWQQILEADEQRRQWQRAVETHAGRRKTLQAFQRRLEDLGRRLPDAEPTSTDPLDVLAVWEGRLKDLTRVQAEQRHLRRDEKARRKEASEYQSRIDELKLQRSALLVQGGASTRDEFEQRAEWVARQQEFTALLEIAQSELETAAAAEPDLAIVEADLLAFQAERNSERIRELNLELEQIERELQESYEVLGSTKQEIRTLESDRRATALRFERAQVQAELKQAAERWFALEKARDAVEQIRSRFERTCQPAMLAAASTYLKQLTGGKYTNIWTPLGRRHLCIEEEGGHPLTVNQLSNGTREQLFLAIRLAMVREFARQGIELPLVLDDILVNFDQLRTEAAIETLLEFAAQGQQILLFTCHLHLAHQFESRGIEPTWLPGHQAAVEERLAG